MSENTKKIEVLKKKLDDSLKTIITRDVSKELGFKVIDIITKRSLRGYGLSGTGSKPFKALADSTKDTRKRYKKNLSDKTRPAKSNITGTGQMLESLKPDPSPGKISIEIPTTKRNRELSGARSSTNNAEVAGYVQKNGRQFFGLTKSERQLVVSEVKSILVDGLKRLLNKK